MEILIASAFTAVGGIFRRFWGGWEQIPLKGIHVIKIIISLILGLLVGLYVFGLTLPGYLCPLLLTGVFLNPRHSKGQGMGKTTFMNFTKSILWMSGSYGVLTLIAGAVLWYLTTNTLWLFFGVAGVLTSAGYLFGWYISPIFFKMNPDGSYVTPVLQTGNTLDGKPAYFIDSATCWGEIVIGMLVLGGLPFLQLLSTIL